jgi:L-alanine-DL-glutamate epimerase-like enolase superfamily enzyme
MRSRPAVFVRLEDREGAFGFGEVWCNFPACGAEHRAQLVADELAHLTLGIELRHPSDLFQRLSEKLHIRALQSGEPGPYAQAIAGMDIAVWDLFARRASVTVRHLLDPDAADSVTAYASGIDIRHAEELIATGRASGYRAFKVKVGFDMADDIARINELGAQLGNAERIFADANQAWALADAVRFVTEVKGAGLGWIEEPLAVDAPQSAWKSLGEASSVPLAGGENIAGLEAFDDTIESGALTVIQPDIAKWGGFSGCADVARRALKAGRIYCPHFLGGGIGLLASAHLLAATGGPGLLEFDINDNPLRQEIWEPELRDGLILLGHAPGLGIEQIPARLLELASYHREVTATGSPA